MSTYTRGDYQALPAAERARYLRELPAALSGFRFDREARFEAFGQATDTAVYRWEDGAEFVFVPGDRMTLGWEAFVDGMDHKTRTNMEQALEEYGVDDLDAFLRDSCTPVRTATVPSMLVERELREIGWYDVPLDHPDICNDQTRNKYLKQYQNGGSGTFTLNDELKLTRRDGAVHAQLYRPVGWEELIRQTDAAGFGIATEDEWEYLCGGGARTLWRWGDSFDYGMKVPHFDLDGAGSDRDIAAPNQFGLHIACDPYRQEVVSGPQTILKGGDGGCNICGGLGLALGFLPVATAYRGVTRDNDELDYLTDIGGDYTAYRRIVRL